MLSSRPPRSIRPAVLVAAAIVLSSCSGAGFSSRRTTAGPSGAGTCALLDSLAASAFLAPPFRIGGKAIADVRQYHLEGDFDLRVMAVAAGQAAGDSTDAAPDTGRTVFSEVLDFRSSSFFGSHREDFTLALTGGVLRLIDRERGSYMEGEDAEAFIGANTGVTGDLVGLVRLVLGLGVDCSKILGIEMRGPEGEEVFSGESARGRFKCSFRGGKLRGITWPVDLEVKGERSLKVAYSWRKGRTEPERLILWIPGLEWRIKLIVEWRGESAAGREDAGASMLSPGTKDGTR